MLVAVAILLICIATATAETRHSARVMLKPWRPIAWAASLALLAALILGCAPP